VPATTGRRGGWVVCALLAALDLGLILDFARTALPRLYSSDFFYPFALYEDLVSSAYSLRGWFIPTAPYFVPDLAVVLPARFLLGDIGYASSLYALFALASSVAAVSSIGTRLRLPAPRATAMALGAATFYLVCTRSLGALPVPFVLLLVPGFHGGTILVGLFLLDAALRLLASGVSSGRLALFAGLAYAAQLSDAIVVPQFLAPILVGLALLTWRQRAPRAALASLTLASIGTSLLAAATLAMLRFGGILRMGRAGVPQFGSLVRLFAFGALCALLAVLAVRTLRRPDSPAERAGSAVSSGTLRAFVALVVGLSAACTFLASVVVAGLSVTRYHQPLHALPIFLLPLLAAGVSSAATRRMGWIGLMALLAAGAPGALAGVRGFAVRDLALPYPERVRCLDDLAIRYGLQYGFADYWNAKYITLSSRAGLRLNQLKEDLTINIWWSNAEWYWRTPDGSSPDYRFVLTEGLSVSAIEARLGPPVARVDCGGTRALVFDPKRNPAFRAFADSVIHDARSHQPRSLRRLYPNAAE
jgi:hypothetical protein